MQASAQWHGKPLASAIHFAHDNGDRAEMTITSATVWCSNSKTKFRGDGECLEGNSGGRAAFMDKCQNVTGQQWRVTPAGNGYVRLQNLMGDNCLEGNRSDLPGAGGAAYMDTKQDVSGQLWKLTEAK